MTPVRFLLLFPVAAALLLPSAAVAASSSSPEKDKPPAMSEDAVSLDAARRALEAELSNRRYEKAPPGENTYLRTLMNTVAEFVLGLMSRIVEWIDTLASHTNTAIALAVLLAIASVTVYLLLRALLPRIMCLREVAPPSASVLGVRYTEQDAMSALEAGDIARALRIAFVLLAQVLRGGLLFQRETPLTNREIALATGAAAPPRKDGLLRAARVADRWFYADSTPSCNEGATACSALLDAYADLTRLSSSDSGGHS